jgi:hypothetical protein
VYTKVDRAKPTASRRLLTTWNVVVEKNYRIYEYTLFPVQMPLGHLDRKEDMFRK